MEQRKKENSHHIFIRRSESEVLSRLRQMPELYHRYLGMEEPWRERFLAFCQGKKTLPLLYDTVFKKMMSPEIHPERLEDCISCLLGKQVKIKAVFPNENILMDGETLMMMDILVELTDSSFVLVEIQKVPYYFPAERASCYSADLLLRQYSRTKSRLGREFGYRDLKKVYTVVFYEKTTADFHQFPDVFVHHAKTRCDSGLELNFLQEFYLISLDVFKKSEYAELRDPNNRLAGWLSFFSTESAEEAEALCQTYPWLEEIYREMASYSRNPEEAIGMFSEMLREMDRNTVRYMVEDMKATIEKQEKALKKQEKALKKAKAEQDKVLKQAQAAQAAQDKALKQAQAEREEREKALAKQDEQQKEIERLKKLLAEK